MFTALAALLFRLVERLLRALHARALAATRPPTQAQSLGVLGDLLRSKRELVAENALLRQQLIVLRRRSRRPAFTRLDRLLLVLLARQVRAWRQALLIVQPETLLRWHRAGFRILWRRRSKPVSPRRRVAPEVVALIQQLARENRLWGAERTVQKYMRQVRAPRPRGQTWAAFPRKIAPQPRQAAGAGASVTIKPRRSRRLVRRRAVRWGSAVW
jgi:putative transposase